MATSISGDVSLDLSKLLDSLGLDEDTRQRRMDIQKMQQLLSSWLHETITSGGSALHSGSAYETTTIDELSSDVDMMCIPRKIHIIDNIQQWAPDSDVDTYMMDNTGCYPAFVKLYLMSRNYPIPQYSDLTNNIPPGHVVDDDGKIFLRNDIMKQNPAANMLGLEVHGPALTLNMVVDIDHVTTLMCKSFPKEAEQWKHRQTHDTRARISGDLVDHATKCFLVGVGNKGSPAENIEWRLSFSHIENQLVHAWNNVQYKCYVMMKFIHKDLVKPKVPDCILCSYHYKTILMWMVEEYPNEFFTESNFGMCVLTVLNNLTMCVTRTSLPHYFVQGCNLFYNKLDKESSKEIAVIIKKIVNTWPYCLFDIERREVGKALRKSLFQGVHVDTVCMTQLRYRQQKILFFDLPIQTANLYVYCKRLQDHILKKQRTEVLKLLVNLVQRSKHMKFYYNTENKQSVTFYVKNIFCHLCLQLIRHSDTMANKAALHYKRIALGCIQRCINDCCFDIPLLAAEYFTRVGNYQRALLLLDNTERRIKPYTVFSCLHSHCRKVLTSSHIEAVFDNKPSLKEYCTHYRAEPVTYTQDNLPHVPRTLVYEMFRTTIVSPLASSSFLLEPVLNYNDAVVHCSVYLYYIRFLCFHALGRYAHRQVALDNMIWASRQLETSPGTHIETNHNIIGDCYRTLGLLHRAYKEYRKSLSKQKNHNAAIWHLALLVRQKVRSHPRQ